MLALIVARAGAVRDGLVALLEATRGIDVIVQAVEAQAAWNIAQDVNPNLTLIYGGALTQEVAILIEKMNSCNSPMLIIVNSEKDREVAVSLGADIVVMEGLPSAKLDGHITTLLQEKERIGLSRNEEAIDELVESASE